jgi:hypothetical protein
MAPNFAGRSFFSTRMAHAHLRHPLACIRQLGNAIVGTAEPRTKLACFSGYKSVV